MNKSQTQHSKVASEAARERHKRLSSDRQEQQAFEAAVAQAC